MNNFNTALDKYLTTPPNDDWDEFYELVEQYYSNEFWEKEEERFLMSDIYNNWMIKLSERTYPTDFDDEGFPVIINLISHETIARIIERAYNIYYEKFI